MGADRVLALVLLAGFTACVWMASGYPFAAAIGPILAAGTGALLCAALLVTGTPRSSGQGRYPSSHAARNRVRLLHRARDPPRISGWRNASGPTARRLDHGV